MKRLTIFFVLSTLLISTLCFAEQGTKSSNKGSPDGQRDPVVGDSPVDEPKPGESSDETVVGGGDEGVDILP